MVLMFSGFTFSDNRVSIAAFFKEFVIDSFHCETMSVILKKLPSNDESKLLSDRFTKPEALIVI